MYVCICNLSKSKVFGQTGANMKILKVALSRDRCRLIVSDQ